MARVVEYLSAHGPVFLEVNEAVGPQLGPRKAGVSDVATAYISKAATTFEGALSNAFTAANAFVENAAKLNVRPDELNIEFGLKISGKADIFVISGNGEANFSIKMKWSANDGPSTK